MARQQREESPSYGCYSVYSEECFANGFIVLDTALYEAAKISLAKGCIVGVWEDYGAGKLRGFGVKGKARWPVQCLTCNGSGSVAGGGLFGATINTCHTCFGHKWVPE